MIPVNHFWVASVIRHLERKGKSTKVLCNVLEEIKSGTTKLTEQQVQCIVESSSTSLDDKNAIISSARYTSLSDYAYIGMLLCSCHSFIDLISDQEFIRRYILQGVEIQVTQKQEGMCIQYRMPGYTDPFYLQILASFLFFANRIAQENHDGSRMTRLLVNGCGYDVSASYFPEQVNGKFSGKHECKVYFQFSQSENAVRSIRDQVFEKVKSIADRDVHHVLVSGVVDRARLIITENIENPILGHRWVASEMGMCERKLQKQLKDEGTSYREILDEVRMRLALHYLKEEHYTVTQTALMLGYTATSNFIRAYKRWWGTTPMAA